MTELKTKQNNTSVNIFISKVENEQQRKDCKKLLNIFKEVTNEKPRMWGNSIVGFGKYHYKSERSSQEGDWMLTGFSPRKNNISIYIMPGFEKYKELLAKIGKHKHSVSCLYIKKLEDIDVTILKKLIKMSVAEMKERYV